MDIEKNQQDLTKKEYQIPSVLEYCMKEKNKQIDMIETTSNWYGVTYKEDKESVMKAIEDMVKQGKYPQELWKKDI